MNFTQFHLSLTTVSVNVLRCVTLPACLDDADAASSCCLLALFSFSVMHPTPLNSAHFLSERQRGEVTWFLLRDKAILLILCSPNTHMPYLVPHSIPLLASLSLLLLLSAC